MRWRPLVLMAMVGVVVASWASPALAKGPDQATITGPGLDEPLVVTGYGEPGSGHALGELAEGSGLFLVMFEQAGRRLTDEAPEGPLGPRFELSYRVPDGNGSAATVRQDLYPQAAGGPVTYTEAGQSAMGMRTSGGWYRTPPSFTTLLEQLGVTAAAQSSAETGADSGSSTAPTASGLPMVPVLITAAGLLLAGVLFGWWRVNGRRSRALPGHPALDQHGASAGS